MNPLRVQHCVEVARHGLIRLANGPDGDVRFDFTPDPRYPAATALARDAARHGLGDAVHVYLLGQFYAQGPKTFSFSARDCEALENYRLDLPAREYAQPYPTLMIPLPRDYTCRRVVPFRRTREAGGAAPADTQTPVALLLHRDIDLNRVFVRTQMSTGFSTIESFAMDTPDRLEDMLARRPGVWKTANHGVVIGPEEAALTTALARLGLTACLLMMRFGTRPLGPDNPRHGERLRRHLQAARRSKDPERIARATWELRALPVRYGFAQDVRLYTAERRAAGPAGAGVTVPPHWRRGHYRRQPCGAGGRERKQVVIKAVLVNAHLLLGDRAATSAAYTVPAGAA